MTKTITITNPAQVRVGDKAYFQNCDFGFTVLDVDKHDHNFTIKVEIPISEAGFWSDSSLFDYATREVEVPEWPKPHDSHLHIYFGSDGKRYIYNPCSEHDTMPWSVEGTFASHTRDDMSSIFPEAIPLIELELIPMESES